jgi:hypothetical protein
LGNGGRIQWVSGSLRLTRGDTFSRVNRSGESMQTHYVEGANNSSSWPSGSSK